ncbi:hypothetical protein BLNAU_23085 [Blattamonas nauphoetae]|uniref:Uncharacterized protein n=1 Tax=Blattamonas nauphoetae TaxID=2049346 RepID=A0ABQ9WR98_9EUKA|nr:hypothetical protein BLNAU_23085 [Blattamonas nauphoetae]
MKRTERLGTLRHKRVSCLMPWNRFKMQTMGCVDHSRGHDRRGQLSKFDVLVHQQIGAEGSSRQGF